MEILSSLSYSLLCVFLFLLLKLLFQARKFQNLPPGPPSLPIIGNLHHLKRPLQRTFRALSNKYGHIISLWFGSRLIVVVSSQTLFQECFTKNDVVLANAPVSSPENTSSTTTQPWGSPPMASIGTWGGGGRRVAEEEEKGEASK